MSRTFALGLFIVLTLLILAAGVFLIGDKEFLFSATFPVRADFQTVAGLNEGADVRVGGIREGTVQRIELPPGPDGKVTIVMKMHNATRALIRKDSVATIKTAGLLGDEFVEVSFGSKGAPLLDTDAVIRSANPVDMAEITSSVATQTKAALTAVQDDMEALKQNVLLRGFFNKRGYEDRSDLTKHAIARLPARTPAKVFDFDAADLFDKPDNAKLRNERRLAEVGSYLEQNEFRQAVVAVSATVGDSDQVRVLTQARAGVIRDALVQKFRFDDTRMRTLGLGKSAALGDGAHVRILIYP